MGAASEGRLRLELENAEDFDRQLTRVQGKVADTRSELERLQTAVAAHKDRLKDARRQASSAELDFIRLQGQLQLVIASLEGASKLFDRLAGQESKISRILGQALAGAGEGAAVGSIGGAQGVAVGALIGGAIGGISEATKVEDFSG